jgi:hypothetical protein
VARLSPPLPEKKLGNIYEFLDLHVPARDHAHGVRAVWQSDTGAHKNLPLFFAGQTLIGPLNQYIHVWAYKDSGERERLRAEASKTVEGWPPATREFLVMQENMLMVPSACAPLN